MVRETAAIADGLRTHDCESSATTSAARPCRCPVPAVELLASTQSAYHRCRVRVRILKPLTGIIEGIPLSQFVPGQIYQVSEDVGAQLVEMNGAIKVQSTDPILARPTTSSADVDVERVAGGVIILPPDTAEDRWTAENGFIGLTPKPNRRQTTDRRKTARGDRRRYSQSSSRG